MIQLYDRDADVVTDVLTLLAGFFYGDTQARADAYNRLENWLPADINETHTPAFAEYRRGLLAGARLKSIAAAIKEQRGTAVHIADANPRV